MTAARWSLFALLFVLFAGCLLVAAFFWALSRSEP